MRLKLRKDAAGCVSDAILQVKRSQRQPAILGNLRLEQEMLIVNNQAGPRGR